MQLRGTQHGERKLITVQTGEGLDTVPTIRIDMRVMSQR